MFLLRNSHTEKAIESLLDSLILDLTYYEVGNAIWKESILTRFITPEESKTMERLVQEILRETERVTFEMESFQKILEIAKAEKLSFYDSSYIHFAKQGGLKLITEDKQLKAKAQRHVGVQTMNTLLSE
jgi:predicted nucleic acid-binding protein